MGDVISAYAYNGDGLRASRTAGGTTASYTWDVGAGLPVVLQETAGGQTTYYVYGLDLIAGVQGGTATYYLTDGLGSTAQLADGAGAVTSAYTYETFGSVRTHTGASTEWTFTGEQNDANGLEYLRARYYDPAIGRFLTQDPWSGTVFSPQSLNPYAYVLNNPLYWVDPWGLDPAVVAVAAPACASGVGCVAVGVAAAAGTCAAWGPCRGAVVEAGEAAWGGIEAGGEAVGGWLKGLVGKGDKKEPKPVYQPYPKGDMVTPWTPTGPGDLLPPGFQPPSHGPGKWMWRIFWGSAALVALERSGVVDMCTPPQPPKE